MRLENNLRSGSYLETLTGSPVGRDLGRNIALTVRVTVTALIFKPGHFPLVRNLEISHILGLMPQCKCCAAETQFYYDGVPICCACVQKLEAANLLEVTIPADEETGVSGSST